MIKAAWNAGRATTSVITVLVEIHPLKGLEQFEIIRALADKAH